LWREAAPWAGTSVYLELLRLEEEREQFLPSEGRHTGDAKPGCGGQTSPMQRTTQDS